MIFITNVLCDDLIGILMKFLYGKKLDLLIKKRMHIVTKMIIDDLQYKQILKNNMYCWFIPKCVTKQINVDSLIDLKNIDHKFLIYVFKNVDVKFCHKKKFFKNYENINILKYMNKNQILNKLQFSELFESVIFYEKTNYKWIQFYHKHIGLSKDQFKKKFFHICDRDEIKTIHYLQHNVGLTLEDVKQELLQLLLLAHNKKKLSMIKYIIDNFKVTKQIFTKKKINKFINKILICGIEFDSFEYLCKKLNITKSDISFTKKLIENLCKMKSRGVKFIHFFHKKLGFYEQEFKKICPNTNVFITHIDIIKYFHNKLNFTKNNLIFDNEMHYKLKYMHISVMEYLYEKMKVTKEEIKNVLGNIMQHHFKKGNLDFFIFIYEMVGFTKDEIIHHLKIHSTSIYDVYCYDYKCIILFDYFNKKIGFDKTDFLDLHKKANLLNGLVISFESIRFFHTQIGFTNDEIKNVIGDDWPLIIKFSTYNVTINYLHKKVGCTKNDFFIKDMDASQIALFRQINKKYCEIVDNYFLKLNSFQEFNFVLND